MAKTKAKSLPAEPSLAAVNDNISLDLGNAYSNLRGDNELVLDWRSIMAPLSGANKLRDWPVEDVIQYEGQWWVVGDKSYTLAPDAIQENPTVNRYISEWYRRLFAFALHKAFNKRVGQEIVYPRVIASIPAGLFKNPDEAEAVKNNLTGDYQIGNVYGGTLHVSVMPQKLLLIPEGVGTYFGFVFGPGNNTLYQSGTWMIADIGYLTLDAIMLRDGEYMPDAARSDEKTGMSYVAGNLQEFVFSKGRVRLDRPSIDKAMECDVITVNQKALNIAQHRTDSLEALGKRASMLLEQWAAGQNLSGIILTGGGAEHLHSYIQSNMLPTITLAPYPRRANVDGAYLYIVSE